MPASETMQVARATGYGPPEVLDVGRAPAPVAGPGEALVRVTACGLGGWDVKRRAGAFGQDLTALPLVLGTEVAGVVEAVGPDAEAPAAGERVFGYVPGGSGGNAGLATCAAEHLAPAPSSLTDAEAAAAPVGVLTAWQTLVDLLAVQPGETLLITGAAGGMGTFAVQLGNVLGARVVASARPRDHDALIALGAEAAVDARGSWVDEVRALAPDGADAVLDCVGGATWERAPQVVRDGGRLCTLVPTELPERPPRGLALHTFGTSPDRHRLTELAGLLDAGDVRVALADAVPLEAVRAAHERFEAGGLHGKLALVPDH